MNSHYFGLISFVIVFLSLSVAYTIQHEKVHKAIYEDYGINSTIKYYWISGLYTGVMGETTAYVKKGECPNECIMAHEYNEIIGYNIAVVVGSIFLCTFLWFIITEFRKNEIHPHFCGKTLLGVENSQE